MKKILVFAVFSLVSLSSCSLFSEDEPLPSELPRRSPAANTSPYSIPGNVATTGFPPLTTAAPAIPEPPILIGSSSVAPFPQSSAPQSSVNSSLNLPTSSPVDLSAAQNSAAGLPALRRPPAFNQASGGVAIAAPITPPAQTMAMPIMPELPPSNLPQVTAIDPVEKFERATKPQMTPMPALQNNEFPRLAQIPASPKAASSNADPRIQSLRADLESAKAGAYSSTSSTTDYSSLKPLPDEPIYKIEAEPNMTLAPTQASAQPRRPMAAPVQYSAPQNITRLSDLRPIAGAAPSVRGNRSSNYKNVGDARHSTAYGY